MDYSLIMKILLLFVLFIKSKIVDKEFILKMLERCNNAYRITDLKNTILVIGNDHGLKLKVTEEEDSIIIAFKGTSITYKDFIGENPENFDKKVNNALFSCCVNEECSKANKTIIEESGYIEDSKIHVENIMKMFPDKKIILTGHSLGGAIASLVAANLGLRAYAFSSPGEKYHFDKNYKLNKLKIVHFGSCSDPIYVGKCNGFFSPCKLAGFNIQTACHLGETYCFGDLNSIDILSHHIRKLRSVIENSDYITKFNDKHCLDCKEEYNENILNIVYDYFVDKFR